MLNIGWKFIRLQHLISFHVVNGHCSQELRAMRGERLGDQKYGMASRHGDIGPGLRIAAVDMVAD